MGDYLHCSHFIAEKSSNAKVLLSALVEVAAVDLHVAASLLRICGSYWPSNMWQLLAFDLYLITHMLLLSPLWLPPALVVLAII